MPSFKPIGVPVAVEAGLVQCGRCAKEWGGPDQKDDCSFHVGPLMKCPHCAATKHACVPLDDYSAVAFNRLVRCRRVLDAFIAARAGRRVNAAATQKRRQLKARVVRERARFLRCLDAAEHDPSSRVGDVRLRKDADKVKRSPLAVAAFREEVRKRAALEHLAQEATKSRRAATEANIIAARSASALEAIAVHFAGFQPAVAAAPDDSDDDEDGEDGNSSDSSASDVDEYRWDSEDDLLDAADAAAHRRDDGESPSGSEGDDAPGPDGAAGAVAVAAAGDGGDDGQDGTA
ncbi:hypothetical protein D6D01_10149 [Aureobasidium pullulans]|uniref:Uncharacterized protein n=1 Tax=Aureobasidium pullulans TaxID=5580 RepID=A0A4S9JQ45_AURPU|nr:hypothetical protein D6D01_10149 [Aureobasidium pullulans]